MLWPRSTCDFSSTVGLAAPCSHPGFGRGVGSRSIRTRGCNAGKGADDVLACL
nr:hypothetical protein JVH1_8812 [Rhodococcus sp. JVH1]